MKTECRKLLAVVQPPGGRVGHVPLTFSQLADVPAHYVLHSWMWSSHETNPKQLQVRVHDEHNFNCYDRVLYHSIVNLVTSRHLVRVIFSYAHAGIFIAEIDLSAVRT